MDVSELDVGTHQPPAAKAVTVADGIGRAMQQLGVVHAYLSLIHISEPTRPY